MVLGKLPVPGRPTIWMIVGQGPIVLVVGAGWGLFGHFTLRYLFSPLSPSLGGGGGGGGGILSQMAVIPRTTNQPTNHFHFTFLLNGLAHTGKNFLHQGADTFF